MLKAKKSLSQNFIIDKNICNKIVNQTNIKNNIVLEIGPGYGFLTDVILKHNPNKIILIEKDFQLKKLIKNKYKENKKVEIMGDDILKFNLNKFENLIILSNLPYNLSSKIILYLFKFNNNIDEMIFMIQKEVSEKFDYKLRKMNKYKFLTYIMCHYERCFDVSNKVFSPTPKVKSSVVKFKFKKRKINLNKAYDFSNLIFRNVRKKINNNLKIKTQNKLLDKRVNELSIDDLLSIYNLF